MSATFKQVSKEEFDAFVKAYPKPLEWNVTKTCEPPLGNHNDFSDGKVWPDSMVTQVFFNEVYKEPNEYYILNQ